MPRPVPPPLERLPEQFFTGVMRAGARVREAPGPPVIDLGRGNPDLPPPAHAVAALQEAAGRAAIHGYPPFQGTAALREALAARYLADHGVVLDPEREIAVVPDTKTGIMLTVLAAAGAGETVLLPDPGYPDYRSAVALAGVREVALPLAADASWQPTFDAAPAAALTVPNSSGGSGRSSTTRRPASSGRCRRAFARRCSPIRPTWLSASRSMRRGATGSSPRCAGPGRSSRRPRAPSSPGGSRRPG